MTRITFDGSYKKVERSSRVIYINMDILLFLITKTKYKCGFYSSNIDIIHITFPIEELCSYVARSDRFFFFSKTLIIFVLSASKCNVIVALLTRGNPVLKCSYLL